MAIYADIWSVHNKTNIFKNVIFFSNTSYDDKKKWIHTVVDGWVDKVLTYKHEYLIPQIHFKNTRHGGACL